MDKRPKIGIDFDDVLFDFNRNYVDHHNRLYGTDMTRDRITNYMMEEVWNMPIEDIFPRIQNFYTSSDHDTTLPLQGAQEALRKLAEHYHIAIITSRPDSVKDKTRAWLDMHFSDLVDEIHFTNQFMGTGPKRTKADVCKELGIEIFIEDAPTYANNISKAGIPVLLLDAPWNQQVSGDLITRVYSWDEITQSLLD